MKNPNHSEGKVDDQQIVDRRVYLTCSILSIIILAVDFITPLGVASGVPYIVVVLMSLKSPQKNFTLIVALVCTLFVGMGGRHPVLHPRIKSLQIEVYRFSRFGLLHCWR